MRNKNRWKKMNKKKTILLYSLVIFSLLVPYQCTAVLSPYIGFNIGDTFEFQFSQFNFKREINNTLIADEDGSDLINNKITVTINEIMEANDVFFKELYGESTYVNVTENFKGENYTVLTALDTWFFFYYDVEMVFDDWIVSFDPEEGLILGINGPDISNYWNFAGLPVLATTNTTFYQSLENELPDYSAFPSMPPDRMVNEKEEGLKLNNRLTQVSLRNDIFKMNVTNENLRNGEYAIIVPWSIEGLTNFYVEINVDQGVVNKFSWLITWDIVLGATTDEFTYEIMIENLNPISTVQIDFQFYQGILLILIGLTIIKLRRKKNKTT